MYSTTLPPTPLSIQFYLEKDLHQKVARLFVLFLEIWLETTMLVVMLWCGYGYIPCIFLSAFRMIGPVNRNIKIDSCLYKISVLCHRVFA